MAIAYFECDKDSYFNNFFDDFVYSSYRPLVDMGFEPKKFNNFSELKNINKNDIIIGCIESTEYFFKNNYNFIPKPITYPKCLSVYLDRNIKSMYYSKLKQLINKNKIQFPIFIKPKNKLKAFTGGVYKNITDFNYIENYDVKDISNLEVYISDVIDIKSEYRCFVYKNKLVGIQHYSGDFKSFLNNNNLKKIFKIIKDFKDVSPISYTLDIGKTINSQIELIEINDFWAIGSYGFDNKLYASMLRDRFIEIKNNKNINIEVL